MKRGLFVSAAVLLTIGLLARRGLSDSWVNVSTQWCGGGCSEGHDDKECICSFNRGWNEDWSGSWNWCGEAACCDDAFAYCDLGYVVGDSDGDGACDWWQDPPPTEWCAVYQDGGWRYCEVGCGSSACGAWYRVGHYEWVNDTSGYDECTRSNETCGFWNSWVCHQCNLADQSPWDDDGSGYVCE
jgi:hypothetical protein